MYLFYAPNIAVEPVLPEEESGHCVQVLRRTVGDEILVTDGVGQLYHCVVTNPHRKHCEVRIESVETPEPLHEGHIHIGIAPTKNIDRTEWSIEKCVEMGVDEITLLLCDHSERKTVHIDRLQKILVSAAKQSLKTRFPVLHPLTKMTDLQVEGDRFIAHCIEGYKASENKGALKDQIVRGHSTTVLIGPEGDFSPEEVNRALANGYQPVSLGAARLRTETAAIVACHTAVLVNE
ncbi:MAG: 16S rRNA (uracil(1498)-N(3))-methyltransferase [Paludibacteraceae bacterium]|nr:16S rRNA (uracil(1498)-N(3))-methyltransferase [Paludibacteraceae bacterium]